MPHLALSYSGPTRSATFNQIPHIAVLLTRIRLPQLVHLDTQVQAWILIYIKKDSEDESDDVD